LEVLHKEGLFVCQPVIPDKASGNSSYPATGAVGRLTQAQAPREAIPSLSREPQALSREPQASSVLDLACGNLRFEAFLANALPKSDIVFYAVDSCDSLASPLHAGHCPSDVRMKDKTHQVDSAYPLLHASLDRANDVRKKTHRVDASSSELLLGHQQQGASNCEERNAQPVPRPVPSFTLPPVRYQSLDVMGTLLRGANLSDSLDAPFCDLSVCFGFMHHVPQVRHREEVLEALIKHTRPGGFVVMSFWQFMENKAMAAKAQESHQAALACLPYLGLRALDKGDYLLGWKGIPGEFRYCHSFSETEIDCLLESVGGTASLVSRFASDGRSGALNTYLIFQVSH
jgi:SAM-dependent methyltransferase